MCVALYRQTLNQSLDSFDKSFSLSHSLCLILASQEVGKLVAIIGDEVGLQVGISIAGAPIIQKRRSINVAIECKIPSPRVFCRDIRNLLREPIDIRWRGLIVALSDGYIVFNAYFRLPFRALCRLTAHITVSFLVFR